MIMFDELSQDCALSSSETSKDSAGHFQSREFLVHVACASIQGGVSVSWFLEEEERALYFADGAMCEVVKERDRDCL